MVHLQMVQIGTKKAFGLNTVEIVRYYVGYYAVCSFDSPTISLLKELVWISWAGGVLFTFILSLIN